MTLHDLVTSEKVKQKVFVSMKNHDTVDMAELWSKGRVLAQVRTAALLAGGRRSGRLWWSGALTLSYQIGSAYERI